MKHFKRTVCACRVCRACCKKQPGPLGVGDLQRITDHLGGEAEGMFVASRGAVIVDAYTGLTRRIGTITPARKPDGSCVFLSKNGLCEIHNISPAGCAYFDTHQSAAEGSKRSAVLHGAIMRSSEYKAQRDQLIAAGHKTDDAR